MVYIEVLLENRWQMVALKFGFLEFMTHNLKQMELMMPVFAKSINQSGWFCCPDVGSIVLVVFLNQDANYPLVIGTTLNAVPGFGKAMWNRCMRKKKYVKQIMKNGVAEIALDENGSIEMTVQSGRTS